MLRLKVYSSVPSSPALKICVWCFFYIYVCFCATCMQSLQRTSPSELELRWDSNYRRAASALNSGTVSSPLLLRGVLVIKHDPVFSLPTEQPPVQKLYIKTYYTNWRVEQTHLNVQSLKMWLLKSKKKKKARQTLWGTMKALHRDVHVTWCSRANPQERWGSWPLSGSRKTGRVHEM